MLQQSSWVETTFHLAGSVNVTDEGFNPVLVVGGCPRRFQVGKNCGHVDQVGIVEVLWVVQKQEEPSWTGEGGWGCRGVASAREVND